MSIDSQLLARIACPADRAALGEAADRLICSKCGRRYPVRDTIPVLLVEEAD